VATVHIVMGRELALRGVEIRTAEVVVAICGLAPHQRAYVRDGLRRTAECHFIDTFDELARVLPGLPRCDALVLATRDARGVDPLATVERVSREWPGTAIVIFCPPRSDPSPSLRSLLLAGAHDFVLEGLHDTATALAVKVANARRECAADAVFRRLQPLIPPELHSMVQAVLTRPDALTSVEDVAAALAVHRKTLFNRCGRCGFLQPAELILWCRLAVVGHQLEQTGSTVEAIAISLGFASHTALRNLMKRHTGLRATEVREGAGLDAVLAALETRLAAWHSTNSP
jgi:AraC-like DNA-binding protein